MAEHNDTGKQGEEIAAAYLAEEGYRIIDRNWRYGKGEVDIVCSKSQFIIFVEVKTRSTSYFGQPEEAVDKKKKAFLIRAADAYVNQKNIPLEVRYDIISIVISEHRHTIRHIEDAFYPTL
jgi:putative endonuclease